MGAGEAGAGPLISLADALRRARPPSLSTLVMLVEDVETYQEFMRLVDEYLPDQRQDITGEGSPAGMVAKFSEHFSKRYFPLSDSLLDMLDDALSDLMRFIPIDVHGYDYDSYHELCHEPPDVVLASLLVDLEEELELEGEGIRLTMLEEAARHVPRELLDRIPERGYPLDFLEQVLPGTRYEGLLDYARHLCHQAGTVFLDVTMEELWSGPPEWTREEVEWLTQEWRKADEMHARMGPFFRWLEEDLGGNFARLLAFLGAAPPPEQMRLPLTLPKEGEEKDDEEAEGEDGVPMGPA